MGSKRNITSVAEFYLLRAKHPHFWTLTSRNSKHPSLLHGLPTQYGKCNSTDKKQTNLDLMYVNITDKAHNHPPCTLWIPPKLNKQWCLQLFSLPVWPEKLKKCFNNTEGGVLQTNWNTSTCVEVYFLSEWLLYQYIQDEGHLEVSPPPPHYSCSMLITRNTSDPKV